MSHNVNDKTQESKTYSYTVKPYTMPYTRYSKRLCLRNQPLETQPWIWDQFLSRC